MTILDLSGMRAYLDGDKEEEREIVQVFVNKATKDLGQIESSIGAGTLDDWQESCHSLKGSAALLGAFVLRDICHEGEVMTVCDAAAQKDFLARMQQAYDEVVSVLAEEDLL